MIINNNDINYILGSIIAIISAILINNEKQIYLNRNIKYSLQLVYLLVIIYISKINYVLGIILSIFYIVLNNLFIEKKEYFSEDLDFCFQSCIQTNKEDTKFCKIQCEQEKVIQCCNTNYCFSFDSCKNWMHGDNVSCDDVKHCNIAESSSRTPLCKEYLNCVKQCRHKDNCEKCKELEFRTCVNIQANCAKSNENAFDVCNRKIPLPNFKC